jgi:hypothetical protein
VSVRVRTANLPVMPGANSCSGGRTERRYPTVRSCAAHLTSSAHACGSEVGSLPAVLSLVVPMLHWSVSHSTGRGRGYDRRIEVSDPNGPHMSVDRFIQVGIREDDIRTLSAKFQADPLQIRAGCGFHDGVAHFR